MSFQSQHSEISCLLINQNVWHTGKGHWFAMAFRGRKYCKPTVCHSITQLFQSPIQETGYTLYDLPMDHEAGNFVGPGPQVGCWKKPAFRTFMSCTIGYVKDLHTYDQNRWNMDVHPFSVQTAWFNLLYPRCSLVKIVSLESWDLYHYSTRLIHTQLLHRYEIYLYMK